METEQKYALIGAGPSGLAGARALSRHGIDFVGFESHSAVGGLWDITNPVSTVYESAHLISSKTTTEFTEFPMPPQTPDYPGTRNSPGTSATTPTSSACVSATASTRP